MKPGASLMRPLVIVLLGVLAGPTPGKTGPEAEALAAAILTHIKQCLPSAASRSVDSQSGRVQAFAIRVTQDSIYPTDLPKLEAAATATIDTANTPAATADSLVRAAIAGVSTYLISLSKSACGRCQDANSKPSLPTSIQDGAIRVIAMPTLYLPEGAGRPCSIFDHYFDFPIEGVSGVVLDLRGNQGGYLPTVICVAGQFLKAKTPLMQVTSRSGAETLESPDMGRRPRIALPVVIFVDRDTESGAIALAAALQDAHRAILVGESKERANAALFAMVSSFRPPDHYLLPVGEMRRVTGVQLTAGVQVDVAVAPQDDAALMEAARVQFGLADARSAPIQ